MIHVKLQSNDTHTISMWTVFMCFMFLEVEHGTVKTCVNTSSFFISKPLPIMDSPARMCLMGVHFQANKTESCSSYNCFEVVCMFCYVPRFCWLHEHSVFGWALQCKGILYALKQFGVTGIIDDFARNPMVRRGSNSGDQKPSAVYVAFDSSIDCC